MGASLNIDVDVLGIFQAILFGISANQNREGFVKDLMETTFYPAKEQYNVMVFNLSQEYEARFNGVQIYGAANHGDVVYGIWVFEDDEFTNKGDGGYINWAFRCWFYRDGSHVKFRKKS